MPDLLRPELFDEPIPRTEEERVQSYGKEWLKALSDRIAARAEKAQSEEPDASDEPIEIEDKFLPKRR
jgi:hypothetical protein